MTITVDQVGLTNLKVRVGGLGNRVLMALEREMGDQMGIMAAAVRANIISDFRNPSKMASAVKDETVRTGDKIVGTVDASGRLSGVMLPYMGIQETGGRTPPHTIVASNANVLAFFWRGQGRMFFGRTVHHPGSVIPAHNFVLGAFQQQKGPMLKAFSAVIGATVAEKVIA